MAGGSRMERRRICHRYREGSLEIRAPQLFWPVRSIRRKREDAGEDGRKIVPRGHSTHPREQAAKYGAAIRLRKSRSLRGPQHSRTSCKGDSRSRWVFRAAVKSGPVALLGLQAKPRFRSGGNQGHGSAVHRGIGGRGPRGSLAPARSGSENSYPRRLGNVLGSYSGFRSVRVQAHVDGCSLR